MSQAQIPRRDPGRAEEFGTGPGIESQAILDFLGGFRLHDQQDVWSAVKRTAQDHEPFGLEAIHELTVLLPLYLLFQKAGIIPCAATRADYGEPHSLFLSKKNGLVPLGDRHEPEGRNFNGARLRRAIRRCCARRRSKHDPHFATSRWRG